MGIAVSFMFDYPFWKWDMQWPLFLRQDDESLMKYLMQHSGGGENGEKFIVETADENDLGSKPEDYIVAPVMTAKKYVLLCLILKNWYSLNKLL